MPLPGPARRPSRPPLALAAGALLAGLLALVLVGASAGRLSVAGLVLVGIGLVAGARTLRGRRTTQDR